MFKNETISIKPAMNGYRLTYDYREAAPTPDNPKEWNYRDEDYIFTSWDQVIEWVTSHQLEVPPTKIN